jgi:hypothetical protein
MNDTTTALTTQAEARDVSVVPGFNSGANWELAQRVAKAFAASTLVPQSYQQNVPNCIIALEMANRMGASPLMVMQNLYIVHGNPGWSSKFLVACFNQCGRFSALRYEWTQDRTACRAWAIEKATGDRIDGPQVSLQMAKDEGWSTKSGSKWKTMPELMLMYRAAAFLIRTYAPEISMGLRTDDEIIDMGPAEVVAPRQAKPSEITALLMSKPATPPSFDPAAFVGKIAACNDLATLQLMSDEAEDLPPGDGREAVMAALRQRDSELAAAGVQG